MFLKHFLSCLLYLLCAVTMPLMASVQAPNIDEYCHTMTDKKKVALAEFFENTSQYAITNSLDKYTSQWCKNKLTDYKNETRQDVKLRLSPFYKDFAGNPAPKDQQYFDLSFICLNKSHFRTIAISAAADWSVLNCIKHKEQVFLISIAEIAPEKFDVELLLQYPNIETFNVFGEFIHKKKNETKFKNIDALQHLRKLKHLYMRNNATPEELAVLAKLPLERLHISNSKDLTLPYIPTLNNLSLSFINGSINIDAIQHMTKLDLIILGTIQNLSNEDLTAFNKNLPIKNLTLAHLPNISDLTSVARLPQLKSITLRNTGVTDLAPLAPTETLRSIYVEGGATTDATSYYAHGGKATFYGQVIKCSPTNPDDYKQGMRCNAKQRNCPYVGDKFAFGSSIVNQIINPICIKLFSD